MRQHERKLLNTKMTLNTDSNQISERVPKVETQKLVEPRKFANQKVERVEVKSNTDHTLQTVELKQNQDSRSESIGKVTRPQFYDKNLSLNKKELQNSKSEQEKLGSLTIKRNKQQSGSCESKQQQQYSSTSKQHCWSNAENRKQERNSDKTRADGKQQKQGNNSSLIEKQEQGNNSHKQQNSESKQQNWPQQQRSNGDGRQLQKQHSFLREQQHQQQQLQHQQHQHQPQQHQAVREARKGSTTEGISAKGQPVPNPKVEGLN